MLSTTYYVVFLKYFHFKCAKSQPQPIQKYQYQSFPVAQLVEHGVSNAKIMGSIPRESKSWSNVKVTM